MFSWCLCVSEGLKGRISLLTRRKQQPRLLSPVSIKSTPASLLTAGRQNCNAGRLRPAGVFPVDLHFWSSRWSPFIFNQCWWLKKLAPYKDNKVTIFKGLRNQHRKKKHKQKWLRSKWLICHNYSMNVYHVDWF